jgi:hypothetical protein
MSKTIFGTTEELNNGGTIDGTILINDDLTIQNELNINEWTFSSNGKLTQTNDTGNAQGVTSFSQYGGTLALVKNDNAFEPQIAFIRTRGSISSKTAVLSNDVLGRSFYIGEDGTKITKQGCIVQIKASEDWNGTSLGTSFQVLTADNGQTQMSQKLLINSNGVTLNNGVNTITLPTTRGGNTQVLTSDGVGGTSWGDQNTTDTFSSLALDHPVNATMTWRRAGSFKWRIQNNSGLGDSLVFENQSSQKALSINQTRNVVFGDGATNYTFPYTRGASGDVLRCEAGIVNWRSRSYGSISINANTTDTVVTQDTWTLIVGTRISGSLNDFGISNSIIQYIGTYVKTFKIDMCLSWETGGGGSTLCAVSIFVGGVLVPTSEQRGQLDDNNTYPRNVSSTCIVDLGPGNTIDVYVKNVEDDDDIVVSYMNLIISEV